MSFEKLNLIKPIQKAVAEEGYRIATPIQAQAIPIILNKRDLLGCAQTGTGKTAAFAIPILQLLYKEKSDLTANKNISALILTPTRELALQIGDSIRAYSKYTGLRSLVIFGGVPQRSQTDQLRRGVDILVATPGRLLDLINQKHISLSNIKFFVLDEADRMLDMGFIHDVNKIIFRLPKQRQSMFFSATMPSEIVSLSQKILVNPVKLEITPDSPTVDAIKQAVYFVSKRDKRSLLVHLLKDTAIDSALVFTRTKHGADNVARFLTRSKIHTEVIHGNKSQNARQRALSKFKSRQSRVLVATDIAARGIDISELSYVINFEMPNISETYVHRIGRTGRAGLAGTALSFCDSDEKGYLKEINKLILKPIPVIKDHPFVLSNTEREKPAEDTKKAVTQVHVKKQSRVSTGKEKRRWSANAWSNR